MMTEDLKVVKDPHRIKVCIEDTRSRILEILKYEDLTIKEIANRLDKDESTVYRHVKKLEENNFVETIDDDNKATKYCRTAHTIFLDPEYMDYEEKLSCILEWDLDFTVKDLINLNGLGYRNEKSEELLDEICSFFDFLDERLKKIVDDVEKDIREKDTLVLLRAKLLTFLLFIYKDEECYERFEKTFSNFNPEFLLESFEGDDHQ